MINDPQFKVADFFFKDLFEFYHDKNVLPTDIMIALVGLFGAFGRKNRLVINV